MTSPRMSPRITAEKANILESLRRQSKSDLIDLVKMHLSFLIDVEAEEWERIVAYVDKEEEESEKLSTTSSNKLIGKGARYFTSATSTSTESNSKSTKFAPPKEKELASNIFGNPLSRESLRQAMLLVDFLNEDDNFKLEGIFRKSGTQERQQDLRYMLNNGVKVDLKANRFTPVDTACVLKEFIQCLPEPLLTINHFKLHFELAKAIKEEIPADEVEAKNVKRLKIIQLLIHLMPELNRTFFISLMNLLNKVARSIEVTKMDERSIATLFGPHVLCPRSWTPKQVQRNIDFITDAMEFLLINYDKLLSGPFELVIDAKKKLIKKKHISNLAPNDGGDFMSPSKLSDTQEEEESDENNTVITFCQRKQSQETTTDQSLAELYAKVQTMPDTPHKRKLIKRFNRQNGFGTPMHVAGKQQSTSSKWKSLIPPMLRSNKH